MEVRRKSISQLFTDPDAVKVDNEGEEFRSFSFKSTELKKSEYQFCSNKVITAKYTIIDFLPKCLFLQFHQMANIYFLFIAILQTVPAISPLSPVSAWLPLVFVLCVSMGRELSEDYQRHRSDRATNSRSTQIYRSGEWLELPWLQVQVGDLIKIENRSALPADILVVRTSSEDGKVFIQTASLDGETNLKPRSVCNSTKTLSEDELTTSNFVLETEQPRGSLEEFDARMRLPNGKKVPVGIENFLPREAVLRHVDWCVGVVCFTGHETRVMKGQQKAPQKVSAIDKLVSKLVFCLLAFQVMVCVSVWILNFCWHTDPFSSQSWYLDLSELSDAARAVLACFTMFLLTSTMIPISLLVTTEMVKFIQALFIGWDKSMIYEEKDFKGDTVRVQSATWSTSTLNEELGQVRYVFSDKTGTLTTNTMVFMACCVGDRRYGQCSEGDESTAVGNNQADNEIIRRRSSLMGLEASPFDGPKLISDIHKNVPARNSLNVGCGVVLSSHGEFVEHFVHALALCQDVTIEHEEDTMIYSGLSPDEVCLVETARNFGYAFMNRTDEEIAISTPNNPNLSFPLLLFIKFTNSRKRSTVIFKDPKYPGKVILYSKGADDVMIPSCGTNVAHYLGDAQAACNAYSKLGLRTLCVSMKAISETEWTSWFAKYQEASCIMDMRLKEESLTRLQNEIERDMAIIACTGTEDKIQDGVPEAIERMREANISVWMITGDKLDTACEIAKSCKLIDDSTMRIDVIDEPSKEATHERLLALPLSTSAKTKLQDIRARRKADEENIKHPYIPPRPKNDDSAQEAFAVVISGRSLQHVFDSVEDTELFFVYSCSCVSAVVCRATKMQKAQVVFMIKSRMPDIITLSIGDGANDVPMLKEAHVGIGVHGKEGSQAVQNADYAIAQFRFLERLLFVHGRWSYIRLTGLIRYFFYKNICFTVPQVFFPFVCAFSGASFYEDWYISTYNLFWTSLPVLFYGIFEYDVNMDISKETKKIFPKFYLVGQRNERFSRFGLLQDWTLGFIHATIMFVITILSTVTPANSLGQQDSFWTLSMTMYTSVVFSVTLNIVLRSRLWAYAFVFVAVGSVCIFLLFMGVYNFISVNRAYMEAGVFFATPRFYLVVVINAVICSMSYLAMISYQRWYNPTPEDIYIEIQHLELVQKRTEGSSALTVQKNAPGEFQGSVYDRNPKKSIAYDNNTEDAHSEDESDNTHHHPQAKYSSSVAPMPNKSILIKSTPPEEFNHEPPPMNAIRTPAHVIPAKRGSVMVPHNRGQENINNAISGPPPPSPPPISSSRVLNTSYGSNKSANYHPEVASSAAAVGSSAFITPQNNGTQLLQPEPQNRSRFAAPALNNRNGIEYRNSVTNSNNTSRPENYAQEPALFDASNALENMHRSRVQSERIQGVHRDGWEEDFVENETGTNTNYYAGNNNSAAPHIDNRISGNQDNQSRAMSHSMFMDRFGNQRREGVVVVNPENAEDNSRYNFIGNRNMSQQHQEASLYSQNMTNVDDSSYHNFR